MPIPVANILGQLFDLLPATSTTRSQLYIEPQAHARGDFKAAHHTKSGNAAKETSERSSSKQHSSPKGPLVDAYDILRYPVVNMTEKGRHCVLWPQNLKEPILFSS